MPVILDACLPRSLARHLTGHSVQTVHELGQSDADDGPLLDALVDRCDAFITMDRNLIYQQNLAGRPFAVIVLHARSNRLANLLPLIDPLVQALQVAVPGEVRVIKNPR